MNGAECGKCGYITCECDRIAKEAEETKDSKIKKLEEALKAKDEQIEIQDDMLHKIKNWCKAYPRDIFPQPDKEYFKKAHKVLKENGLSLTRISADNIRHVVEGIQKIIDGQEMKGGNIN